MVAESEDKKYMYLGAWILVFNSVPFHSFPRCPWGGYTFWRWGCVGQGTQMLTPQWHLAENVLEQSQKGFCIWEFPDEVPTCHSILKLNIL